MKLARKPDGTEIKAGPSAPRFAVCPGCGGIVRLRTRRTMDKTRSYFWRHQANSNLDCVCRHRPGR